MRELPAPGECHPAYQDMPWLRDWLNDVPGSLRGYHVRVPYLRRRVFPFDLTENVNDVDPVFNTHTLTKEKAAGLAPYVGDPFVYVWYVATDELGRAVAGDAEVHYLDPVPHPLGLQP